MTESAPSVRCGKCGHPIDEPTDLPPAERKPCPNCGSTTRAISVTLADRLDFIGDTYAKAVEAGNERIEQLRSAQAAAAITRGGGFTADAVIAPPHTEAHAGVATGTATAHDATVMTESALAAEVRTEQDSLTQAAIRTLIDVVRVGQEQSAIATAQSAEATAELNHLTRALVRWTKFIGVATVVAVIVGIAAIVVAAVKG